MKLNKLLNLLLFIPVLSLVSCGKGWQDGEFETFEEEVYVDPSSIKEDKLNPHTALQQAYINSTWDTISKFANGKKELSRPKGIDLDIDTTTTKYLKLSLNEDMSDARIYTFLENSHPNIYNLLNDTKYYYEVSDTEDFKNATLNSFTTANSLPRNLYINGVTNVRDLGGYESRLGGHIKQNMYIRGGRLTVGKWEPEAEIKPDGYEELTKHIKVHTEIDLRRSEEVNFNPENGHMDNSFFKEIEYHTIPMDTKAADNMMELKEDIKKVFDVLSVEAGGAAAQLRPHAADGAGRLYRLFLRRAGENRFDPRLAGPGQAGYGQHPASCQTHVRADLQPDPAGPGEVCESRRPGRKAAAAVRDLPLCPVCPPHPHPDRRRPGGPGQGGGGLRRDAKGPGAGGPRRAADALCGKLPGRQDLPLGLRFHRACRKSGKPCPASGADEGKPAGRLREQQTPGAHRGRAQRLPSGGRTQDQPGDRGGAVPQRGLGEAVSEPRLYQVGADRHRPGEEKTALRPDPAGLTGALRPRIKVPCPT